MRSSVLAIIRESDEPIVCVPLNDENVPADITHSVSPSFRLRKLNFPLLERGEGGATQLDNVPA